MTEKMRPSPDGQLRLNVALARGGHGSRRSVESLIRAGRVTIDGRVERDLARRVDPTREKVAVDGLVISLPTDVRIYAFHKPLDVVCTLSPQGDQVGLDYFRRRSDVADRFQPIGRLDHDSTGLLLWTDDGSLAQTLLRPTSGVWKTYEVLLTGNLDRGKERVLAGGQLVLDGRLVRACRIHADKNFDRRRWTIELHEGRKRQIRRMFAAVGARVAGLHRTAVGPIRLERLRPGDFRRLNSDEERALRLAMDGAVGKK